MIVDRPALHKKWYYVAPLDEAGNHQPRGVELHEVEDDSIPDAVKLRIQGIRNIGVFEWTYGGSAKLVKTLAGD